MRASPFIFAVCFPAFGLAAPPTVDLSRIPLVFEENRGQARESVPFQARGRGFRLQLQQDAATLDFHDSRIVLRWHDASAAAIRGVDPTGGESHYYLGDDPSKWVTRIRHYSRVRYESIYPGTDLVFYGNRRQMECDWVLQPGADPSRIRFTVESDAMPALSEEGDLQIGKFTLGAPVMYQPSTDGRTSVNGRYHLEGREVSFEVDSYDPAQTLVIDPTLAVTYLGGRDVDIAAAITADSTGFLYLTGYTLSGNFPVSATPYKNNLTAGDADAFVMKINPGTNVIIYSTFLGGAFADYGRAIAVDSSNAAYITGSTLGRFPVTAGAFSAYPANSPAIFAAKLDSAGGTLAYATYLDGAGAGQAIGVDTSGNAYVAGYTYTATLSTTTGALQRTYGGSTDGFLVKLNPSGAGEVYATFLGGSGEDQITGIRVDASGNAFVTGFTSSLNFPTSTGAFRTSYSGSTDAFVAKLSAAGSSLVYSTLLGGSNIDRAYAIDVNSSGEAFVAGQTYSSGFPTTAGAFRTSHGGGSSDAFVTRVNASGSNLIYSTFLGGSGVCSVTDPFRVYSCDAAYGIAVNPSSQAYVVGLAGAAFPLAGALQSTPAGTGDAFVALLDAGGSYLLFSSYLGGGGTEVATGVTNSNASGPVLIGFTNSTDLPIVQGALQSSSGGGSFDGFVSQLRLCSAAVVSSGSFFPSTAGSYQLGITSAAGCAWYATVDQPWVTFTVNAGVGNGSISYHVAANNAPSRTATINVMGSTFLIQQVAGCYVTLGSSGSWFPQAGLSGLTLPVFSNCNWTATTQSSWITFVPSSWTGSSTITYWVAANNTGSARYGSILVNDQTFSISQVGGPGGLSGCTFSLSSTSDSYNKDGGSSSVLVSTQDGCDWAAVNPNSWIVLTGGTAGNGSGVMGYTVHRNTSGETRMGALVFGDQSLTILQTGN